MKLLPYIKTRQNPTVGAVGLVEQCSLPKLAKSGSSQYPADQAMVLSSLLTSMVKLAPYRRTSAEWPVC